MSLTETKPSRFIFVSLCFLSSVVLDLSNYASKLVEKSVPNMKRRHASTKSFARCASLRACSGSVSRHVKICDQLMAFCVVSAFLAPFENSQILLVCLFSVWIPHHLEDMIALPCAATKNMLIKSTKVCVRAHKLQLHVDASFTFTTI